MTDAWPNTLPQCLNVGFGEAVGDGLLESQPDAGPPMVRRRSSAVTRPLSGQMRMTRVQIGYLRTFFETTLMGGALPFTFPDPHNPAQSLLVRFSKSGLPRWSQVGGGVFRVEISLMVLP